MLSMKDIRVMPSSTALRLILLALLVAAIAGMLGWFSPAGAQTARAAQTSSRVQAERASVDLKQGMTSDEVDDAVMGPAEAESLR